MKKYQVWFIAIYFIAPVMVAMSDFDKTKLVTKYAQLDRHLSNHESEKENRAIPNDIVLSVDGIADELKRAMSERVAKAKKDNLRVMHVGLRFDHSNTENDNAPHKNVIYVVSDHGNADVSLRVCCFYCSESEGGRLNKDQRNRIANNLMHHINSDLSSKLIISGF